jgi:hypothetical protein
MLRASAFFGALVLMPALASAQQPCTTDARHVVNEVYRHVLERSADRGSDAFVQRLARGDGTVREIVRDVAKSSEHTQRFAAGGNREAQERAVANLYRHILGRQADPDGLRAHADGMAASGVGAVVDSLVNSGEYQQSFGDYGVPGSPGLRYCAPGQAPQTSSAAPAAGAPASNMRFREMDANRDGVVTRPEWRGTAQSFRVLVWIRDGVLSREEVRTGARREAVIEEEDFNPAFQEEFNAWTPAGFTSIDHNRDGRITSAEWHYNTETFRRVDRNRDGALSRAEFLSTDMDDDRDDRFEYLDVNGNGRVERSEWHGSADAFDWLDRNKNNSLSRAEVVGSASASTDNFASLDVDRDGRLSVDEWHWSRRSFDQQDTNRDGVITRREFTGGPVPTTGR